MTKKDTLVTNNGAKCYKSASCIISVFIIVFIFSNILYDLCYSKPKIREDINSINKEIMMIDQRINKIDSQQVMSSEKFLEELRKSNSATSK